MDLVNFDFNEFVVNIFNSWQFRTLVALVVLDVALGVGAALVRKTFDWTKVADFYGSNVVPYLLGWAALAFSVGFLTFGNVLVELPPDIANIVNEATVDIAWAALLVRLGGSILENFRFLYSGTAPAPKA